MSKTKKLVLVILTLAISLMAALLLVACHGHVYGYEKCISPEGTPCEQRIYEAECYCGKIKTIEGSAHKWVENYSFDSLNHWQECRVCGVIKNKGEHIVELANKCAICKNEIATSGLIYKLDGDSYIVEGYDGNSRNVIIAGAYNGKPVKAIAEDAFFQRETLKSVEIPNSIMTIGNRAFASCADLESITVAEDNEAYKSMAGNLYSKNGETLVQFAIGKEDKTFSIPDGVKTISESAFAGSRNLVSVDISGSVKTIDKGAFSDCDMLESMFIPKSVTNLGDGAFSECDRIEKIEIQANITSIGDNMFANCISLTIIELPVSLVSIGDNALSGCKDLQYNEYDNALYLGCEENPYVLLVKGKSLVLTTSCIINQFTKIIYSGAFQNFYNMVSLEIPNSIESIGNMAFDNCSSLTSIELPERITNIGDSAFRMCRSFSSIAIPDGVTSIGDYAFYGCEGITSIAIPDGVTSIGDYAFYGCEGITSIAIPDGVTSIGERAFYGCEGITSIAIPAAVMSIGDYAFDCCGSLTSIAVDEDNVVYKSIDGNLYSKDGLMLIKYAIGKTDSDFSIPDSVITIGDRVFYNCLSLTSIVIPDSVISIGDQAFQNCESLENIVIPNGITKISIFAFYGCESLSSIVIPDSATKIESYAFNGCTSLTSIVIGGSVERIGDGAFDGCVALKDVYYKGTAAEWSKVKINNFFNSNSYLLSATMYFYSDIEPDNYWHYDENGEVVVW